MALLISMTSVSYSEEMSVPRHGWWYYKIYSTMAETYHGNGGYLLNTPSEFIECCYQLITKDKFHCQIQHSHEPGLTIIHVKLINDTDDMIQISTQWGDDEFSDPTSEIKEWIDKISLQTFVYHFIHGFSDMLVKCGGTYQDFITKWHYSFDMDHLKAVIEWVSYFNKTFALQVVEQGIIDSSAKGKIHDRGGDVSNYGFSKRERPKWMLNVSSLFVKDDNQE